MADKFKQHAFITFCVKFRKPVVKTQNSLSSFWWTFLSSKIGLWLEYMCFMAGWALVQDDEHSGWTITSKMLESRGKNVISFMITIAGTSISSLSPDCNQLWSLSFGNFLITPCKQPPLLNPLSRKYLILCWNLWAEDLLLLLLGS